MSEPNSEFRLQARVYWEDTDASGVVYHAKYLHFLERARTEWLRQAGMDQSEAADAAGVFFTVKSLSLHFKRPARLDDLITVVCSPSGYSGASVSGRQTILRGDEVLLEAEFKLVTVSTETFRPVQVPPSIRRIFEERGVGLAAPGGRP